MEGPGGRESFIRNYPNGGSKTSPAHGLRITILTVLLNIRNYPNGGSRTSPAHGLRIIILTVLLV